VISPKKLAAALVLLVAVVALVVTGIAGAAPSHPHRKKHLQPPARIQVEAVRVGHTPGGRLAILARVRYPIEAANRVLRIGVHVRLPGRRVPLATGTAARLNAGAPRLADRRHRFTFVHEIDLPTRIAKAIEATWAEGRKPVVTVEAESGIDIDGDGKPDIRQKGVARRVVQLGPGLPRRGHPTKAPKQLCATVPVVTVPAGTKTQVALPACAGAVHWHLESRPEAGSARLDPDTEHLDLVARKQPGTETVELNEGTVLIKVSAPASALTGIGPGGPVVRAMGDSVTAGYGYYSDGSQMSIFELPECKPFGQVLDDACSSNSTATKSGLDEVPYAPDYGLANNVSWAAQWANDYGATNYKNFAISGSEPTNWAPGGDDYALTRQIEGEDPDYILMTIGANPILAETLFGLEPIACAIKADILGEYRVCVEKAFEKVKLRTELKRLYTDLVEKTNATIYLMQYHLAVPSSAIGYTSMQIAEMAKLMNATIAEVAEEVGSPRLQVISPPHFNVGVSLEPVYPSTFSCSYLGFKVDGPSVQSTPTQVELSLLHLPSFCKGPAGGGKPWIISGDTGIHPSAIGYAQMASQIPAPGTGN
jgi:lysophospholipase L1-like esterase